MALDAVGAIRQLQDRSSAKRRSAAKRLRTLGDPDAGPALLETRETLHAVHTAGGDAIVRLSYMEHSHAEAIRWCLSTGNETLVGGALQAVAMLRLAPDQETVTDVLDFIEARSAQDGVYFWPAVAAAGWTGRRVHHFLTSCISSPRPDVAEAATYSLAGNYGAYRPL